MSGDVLVVVTTYNSAHVVGDLLDSLPVALAGLEARVVVVDNGSTDDTVAVLERRGDAAVVRADNRGYSAGINRGVAEAPGPEPVLVLNPDVRLSPGCVPAMLAGLDDPQTGIVAPRVLDDDGRLVRSLRREPSLGRAGGLSWTGLPSLSERLTDPAAYDETRVVDWATGAALLVDRRCHEALGGWDESFFLYSEETDFCLRARDRGWVTRYEPTAVVSHIGGQSGTSPRIHAMQIVNRVRLYRRRTGPTRGAAYWLLNVVSELSWIVRGHRQSLTSVRALLQPSSRAPELGCSHHLVPGGEGE